MKIYNYINFTKNTNAITCSEYLAKQRAEMDAKKGDKVQLWEGDLKTQGVNFHTWVSNWKKLEPVETDKPF